TCGRFFASFNVGTTTLTLGSTNCTDASLEFIERRCTPVAIIPTAFCAYRCPPRGSLPVLARGQPTHRAQNYRGPGMRRDVPGTCSPMRRMSPDGRKRRRRGAPG